MFHRKPEEIRVKKNRRTHKNRRAWKQESRAGTSLIMVVCVSAFLVAFALSMVYTGSMLMARANRRLKQERCYQLARSFAQVVDEELDRYKDVDDLQDPAQVDGDYADSLFRFSCRFLEDTAYREYNPEYPELTTYTYEYRPAVEDKQYGAVTLVLYKENDQDTDVMEDTLPENPADQGTTINDPLDYVMNQVSRYTLYVEVVAELDGMTYSYVTSYETLVGYQEDAVEFTAGGARIFWDDTDKQWRNNGGDLYSVPAGTPIDYKIHSGFHNLQSCSFQKTIPEGENTEEENPGGESGGGDGGS